VRPRPDGAEAVLFPTCYVQNNEPEIGRDTLEVMERNGVKTACVKGLQCCGMPAWETGDLETVRRQAASNLQILKPFVDAGAKVIALNPTCAMMMRREYPELLPEALRPEARRLAELVRDPSELLWEIRNEPRFNTDFKSTPGGPVAYHAPCHLRAQAVGFKGRDLLRKIPGVQPKLTMECCGHDGTYAMKVEGFENSIRVGQKAFDGMKEAEAEVWATDCPLAALQFQQHAGRKPLHPMSVLARAYRADGFPTPVAKEPEKKDGAKG
jgi:Fe-S oxidoreductase